MITALHAQDQNTYEEIVWEFRQEMVKSAMDYAEKPPLTSNDTSYLAYFPIEAGWKVNAQFSTLPQDSFIQIPTTAGTEKVFKVLGRANFRINDTLATLTVYQPFRQGLQPYLFIPFKDATSGLSTYGGGRYLELGLEVLSDDQNSILLDFNKAFNPWCAYRSGYFCPLPPEENHMQIAITAGEKNFSRDDDH